MKSNYVIVTPVKNEELYIGKTINSVIDQTIRPQQWIIVNDGSTDKTGEIIQSYARKYLWIKEIQNERSASRKIGGQAALMHGLKFLNVDNYDYFVRMDGDVTFDPYFFESAFQKFKANLNLGIASGVCYVEEKDRMVEEKNPRFHTRGPLKIYRVECYKAIGGLDPEEGWDTIDEVKANMLDWQTRNFPELKVHHLRKTQTASGTLQGRINIGKTAYYLGYHPLFLMARAIKNMTKAPYILGGFYMLAGYFGGYLKKQQRLEDSSFVAFLRKQQINRLLGRETIWK